MVRNRRDAFGSGAIVLHWTIAAVITSLMFIGYVMTRQEIDPALQFSLYQWHKSLGMAVLALAAVRVGWWLFDIQPEEVEGLTPLERRVARLSHGLLRALPLAVPLAGWALASSSPLNIPTFLFNLVVIPHLPLEKSDAGEAFWVAVHGTLAFSLLALIVLHTMAALYHHFWRRDEVLVRMLRAGSAGADGGKTRPRNP